MGEVKVVVYAECLITLFPREKKIEGKKRHYPGN